MWDEKSGCFDPCTLGYSSSGWGHWPLADAGSLSGILNSDWPSAHPGSLGRLSGALNSHWAERRAFLLLLLLDFLGRGKARGAPGEALVAMVDAWVSLVSTGEVRDFVWALRDFTGVSRGRTQLSQICTGISLDCTGVSL